MANQRITGSVVRVATLALLATLLLLSGAGSATAQTSPNFDLTWHVVAGGGGTAASASFRLAGTIGQALPGPPVAAGATYAVTGGFWSGAGSSVVYLPAILRG